MYRVNHENVVAPCALFVKFCMLDLFSMFRRYEKHSILPTSVASGTVPNRYSKIRILTVSLLLYLLVVDIRRGRDLSEYHNHACLCAGLASDTGDRILANACVKNCIRHLIAKLIYRREECMYLHLECSSICLNYQIYIKFSSEVKDDVTSVPSLTRVAFVNRLGGEKESSRHVPTKKRCLCPQ
jgi:hypothetical protein